MKKFTRYVNIYFGCRFLLFMEGFYETKYLICNFNFSFVTHTLQTFLEFKVEKCLMYRILNSECRLCLFSCVHRECGVYYCLFTFNYRVFRCSCMLVLFKFLLTSYSQLPTPNESYIFNHLPVMHSF